MNDRWTWRDELNFFRYLTIGGKWEWIVYRVRSWFIEPAPKHEGVRCIMGSPVGDSVWCPRYAVVGSAWCPRHARDGKRVLR